MNDFDEYTAGSNCILGMMGNGKSQHHSVFDWASDRSGTYPSNELDLTTMVMGEDVMDEFAEECNAEEELLAELQREFAENVRAMEMCTSMTAMNAAAEQSAMEVRRKAARGEEKASRAQAVTERAALGAPMESAAVNTKSTCEHQGSVRGPRAAATRLRTPYQGPMTTKEYGISGILDEDDQRETVLVRWVNPHGSSWEPRGMMHDQFDREVWTSFLDAKLRKKRELQGQGIVGPYISGTELGYANPEMVLAGFHPETAAVGHPLQKVTGRRGVANAM
jgi:hypothetical protein